MEQDMREKVIKALKYLHDVKRWSPDESEESITARRNITGDAIALLKEYDEALKLMVYQYCTMKPLTVHDEVFHNKFMSAGEAAFRLLGLENGQSTDGVWERWFPNG